MVRDGWVLVFPLAALAAVSVVIGYLTPGAIWIVLASVFGGLALFVAFFFRDPARQVPPGDGLVISGGDGKVVTVSEIEHDPFIGGPATQISVFLSIVDVHVNRIPITGVVRLRRRIEGKFKLAFKDEASGDNAQTVLGIEGDRGAGSDQADRRFRRTADRLQRQRGRRGAYGRPVRPDTLRIENRRHRAGRR